MDRIAYKWRHLEDYCVSPDSLALSELRALADVWEDQRGALERVEALQGHRD